MSGHSKWATIKHKKAALDAKRGKSFTRIIKEIMIAARQGGDPDMNPRLRTAIVAAKAVSMPAENIKKAIMRGTGELEGGQIDEIMFEGYGPGGAAVLVDVATDNRNRTVSEIRHMFSKNGGNLAEVGAVSWMFERKGHILVEKEKASEDQLMNIVLDAGAEDMRDAGDNWEVVTAPEAHEAGFERHSESRHTDHGSFHRHASKKSDETGRQERASHAASERSAGGARRRAERVLQLRRGRKRARGDGLKGDARPGHRLRHPAYRLRSDLERRPVPSYDRRRFHRYQPEGTARSAPGGHRPGPA